MSLSFLRNCNPVWDMPKPVTTRQCRACGETKPLADYYAKGKESANGEQQRFFRCKSCMVAAQIKRNRRG